ncbi:MAG: hypothetical protein H0T62_06320 [Parachlamydiaceae bacterium]|nr:hypothetical protein [Parachlamydiaceae bacterium]
MNLKFLGNTYAKFGEWNQKVDAFASKTIHASLKILPCSCGIIVSHETHTKVALLGSVLIALVSTIFNMSCLPRSLKYFLGLVVTISVGSPTISNLKQLPIIIKSTSIVQRQFGIFYTAIKNSCQSEIDQLNSRVQHEVELLEFRVEKLKKTILNFDSFIFKQPDLLDQCQKYLIEENNLVSIIHNGSNYLSTDLDSSNVIDKKTHLWQQSNQLKYLWDARLEFLERHHDVKQNLMKQIEVAERKVNTKVLG